MNKTEFKNNITLYADLMDPNTSFDDLLVYPVHKISVGKDSQEIWEQCEPSEAEMWSMYIHIPDNGIECIADCDTRETAEALGRMLEITAKMYIRE